MIPSDGAEICAQAFGEPSDPALLLIPGQMSSMLWWREEFCARLASAGRFVIRYDQRDTGRSTSYEPGKPPYTGDDLTADVVAVLDGLGVDRAHLAGISAGGAIAQLVALGWPDRVATVTAISTTNAVEMDPGLPGPSADYLEHAAAFETLDWSDTQALADLVVRDARQLAGSRHPFDEAAARELVERDLARARNPASLRNHSLAEGGGGRGDLTELRAPLLVIHGDADPLFPPEHGAALAAAVPGAQLVTISGGGHELHEGDWDQIADAILAHTSAVS